VSLHLPDRNARRVARIAAVQALYQMELSGIGTDDVLREFVDHRFVEEPVYTCEDGPDTEFFSALVRGVAERQTEIDLAISSCLSANWTLTRIDSILRAILRSSAFELLHRKDVPVPVVIDEYIEISHAFFTGDEPSFVNAALDRLAREAGRPALKATDGRSS
jgi:N utilization substance protein B